MINPLEEQPISLLDAAKLLPGRRNGKRPTISCFYRWTGPGCRGVVLESIQVGGTRCTTKEAVARFISELSRLSAGHRVPQPKRKLSRAIEKKLEKLGLGESHQN